MLKCRIGIDLGIAGAAFCIAGMCSIFSFFAVNMVLSDICMHNFGQGFASAYADKGTFGLPNIYAFPGEFCPPLRRSRITSPFRFQQIGVKIDYAYLES